MRKLVGPFLLALFCSGIPQKSQQPPPTPCLPRGGWCRTNVRRKECKGQISLCATTPPSGSFLARHLPLHRGAHRIGIQKKILQSKRFFGKRRRRRKWRGDDGRHPPHYAPCGDAVTPSGSLRSPASRAVDPALGQEMPRTMGHFQVRKWSTPHRGVAKKALAHPQRGRQERQKQNNAQKEKPDEFPHRAFPCYWTINQPDCS